MRKGSRKVATIDQEHEKFIPADELHFPKIDLMTRMAINTTEMRSILLRICDACHDMDNRVEPWASIRKEIEALR